MDTHVCINFKIYTKYRVITRAVLKMKLELELDVGVEVEPEVLENINLLLHLIQQVL